MVVYIQYTESVVCSGWKLTEHSENQ